MKIDLGFWNQQGEYIQDIQEINKMDMDKYFEELNDMANFKGFGEKPEPEKIFRDGVDVAGCKFIVYRFSENPDYSDYCCEIWDNECEAQNCYYKQFQRLQQENAELKEKIKKYAKINEQETKDYAELKAENERLKEELAENNCFEPNSLKCKHAFFIEDKLKQTLQEIKEIAEKYDNLTYPVSSIVLSQEILQKISEVME